ncbi:ATP-binding protein [Flexistipes sp.]|uniref:ATP-binding protein n=1 Tax=Flexistipes sp. TaxID=3088135 RepID=UPI002E23206B|nr:ATP-binding protein [Flexistipes sp.]
MFEGLVSVFDITPKDFERRNYIYRLVKKNKKLISKEFYEFLNANSYTNAFLGSKERITRLSKTQEEFQENLFSMDFDDLIPYIYNVGLIHYRINLDNTYVISAHSLLKNIYTKILYHEDISNKFDILITIEKFLSFSLGVMVWSYYEKSDVCIFDIKHIKNFLESITDLKIIHKTLLDDYIKSFKQGRKEYVYNSLKNYKLCQFHVTLTKYQSLYRFQDIVDIESIIDAHKNIHEKGAKYFEDFENGEISAERFIKKLRQLSSDFTDELEQLTQKFIFNQPETITVDFINLIGDIIRLNYKSELTGLIEDFRNYLLNFNYLVKEVVFVNEQHETKKNEIIFRLFLDSQSYTLCIKLYDKSAKPLLQTIVKISGDLFQELYTMHKQEKRLGELADQVSESDHMKTLFIANVSHEIRTPLNSILGFAQLIQMKQNIDETTKKYVANIIEAGNKLLDHINKVIDFAKLESGKMIINMKEVTPKTFENKIRSIISPLLREKNLTFNSDFSGDFTVNVDVKLIEDVLINLISNAIKYSDEDSQIDAGCYKKGEVCRFYVRDYGQGISREHVKKIFSPFYQVDKAYNNPVKGSGLGLAIVKSIVEKHGGNIWVDSEPGKGTVFWFDISG